MQYRGDIDGLRAVAVIMVVLYHFLGHPDFNGYVGVDVFFVISGYLITRIIADDINAKRFSLIEFYERRARRIMPALTVMLGVSALAAYFLFLPREMEAFAESLIGASTFLSNLFFWQESGYFDREAALKPLLHTWSLAVEEQFYIFYPPLLWAMFRYARQHIKTIFVTLIALSFTANVWFVHAGNYETSFYLFPMRAWELLAGGVLALGWLPSLSERTRKWAGLSAFVILALSFGIRFDSDRFPGIYALGPVLGAFLVIYAGQGGEGGWFGRFLAAKPMRFVGKISYSLYLWHWPVYVFAAYYLLGEVEWWHIALMLVGSFTLAYGSWRYVEQPWRQDKIAFPRNTVFVATLASIAVMVAAGTFGVVTNGAAYKFSERSLRLSEATIGGEYTPVAIEGLGEHPRLFKAEGEPVIAVWGDSHAQAIAPAAEKWAEENGVNGILIDGNSCFLPSEIPSHVRDGEECVKMTDAALAYFAATPSIKTVLLTNRWAEHLQFWQKHGYSLEEASALRLSSLQLVINKLRGMGKRVLLLEQAPQVKAGYQDIPSVLARIDLYGLKRDLRPTIEAYEKEQIDMIPIYAALESDYPGLIVSPREVLCTDGHCAVERDGVSYYYDDDHLSRAGAQSIAPLLNDYISTRP